MLLESALEKNQNTNITAITAPRNIAMVINHIICARIQTSEPTAKRALPSLS
jgi:hypothetical protein